MSECKKTIPNPVKMKSLTFFNYLAICLFVGRAIWGNVEFLYLGMLSGLFVFIGQLIYKKRLPPIVMTFITIIILSYIFTFANNSLERGALFVPLTLSHIGVAWRISTHGLSYKFSKFLFIGSLLYFLYGLVILNLNASQIFANSRNYVSVYFLNILSIFFISIYLSSIISFEKIKVIVSAAVTFIASLISIGSMGIFASFMLLVLSSMRFLKKATIFFLGIFCIFTISYMQDWDGFINYMRQFEIFNKDRELLAKMGYLQLTQANPRYGIWEEYITSLDIMRLFFGINLSERFHGFANYHNSFVLLHARTGFYMFIITLIFLYSLIKAYRINYLLASCLLVLLFRSLTDTTILAGSAFDFVLFFLIFFLGQSKNKIT
jgi:hypothetical protein